MEASSSTTTEQFVCEQCGKAFDKQQALGGHISAAHRSPDAKPTGRQRKVTPVVNPLRESVAAQIRQPTRSAGSWCSRRPAGLWRGWAT
jgi:hypothetical protein